MQFKPNFRKAKMNVNLYIIEDYENETTLRPKKTNPIKANFRKSKMNLKSLARKSGHTLSYEVPKKRLLRRFFCYNDFEDLNATIKKCN